MKLNELKTFPATLIRGQESIIVYGLSADGYSLSINGISGALVVYEADSTGWSRADDPIEYHQYWMQSTSREQSLRPILTFVFNSTQDAEAYAQKHDYVIVDYKGKVERSGL